MFHICGVISLGKKDSEEEKEGILDWIRIVLLMIIILPFLIIGGLIVAIYAILEGRNWRKCSHWRECPLYNPKDITCNDEFGMYSGFDKPSGCYISIDEKKAKLKIQGKKLRRLR